MREVVLGKLKQSKKVFILQTTRVDATPVSAVDIATLTAVLIVDIATLTAVLIVDVVDCRADSTERFDNVNDIVVNDDGDGDGVGISTGRYLPR